MPRQYEKVFWQLVQTAARIYINGNCFLSRSDSHRACKNVPAMSFSLCYRLWLSSSASAVLFVLIL